jgi:hypothetical protein
MDGLSNRPNLKVFTKLKEGNSFNSSFFNEKTSKKTDSFTNIKFLEMQKFWNDTELEKLSSDGTPITPTLAASFAKQVEQVLEEN